MNDQTERQAEDSVRNLLAAAGLPVTENEIATLARSYPALRTALNELHNIAAGRYAKPALRFAAEPPTVPWWTSACQL